MSNWNFLKRPPEVAGTITPESPEPAPSLGSTGDWRVRTVVVGDNEPITNLKTWGFIAAGKSSASPEVLKTIIGWIYHNKITVDDAQAEEEQQRIGAISEQLSVVNGDLSKVRNQRREIEQSITRNKELIAQKKSDMTAVQAGDGTVIESHGLADRASFFIASAILAVLTVYLFLFYVSAIYNAFIFNPTNAAATGLLTGKALSVTIFNGQAFQQAWSEGLMTFAFLSTAPSIVIGMGFLIHHFQKAGKTATIVVIIAVTFFFDFLLAYQIVHQIDTINTLTGLTTTPWSLSVLISSPEFWIILLAGFVVYIIWGMILQAVLEGVEKFHPARVAMRSLRESIKNCESSIEALNKDLAEIGNKEADLVGKIGVLEQQKSPKELKNNQFLRHIEEVMHGWLEFISNGFPDDRDTRQAEAQRVRYETVQLLVGR